MQAALAKGSIVAVKLPALVEELSHIICHLRAKVALELGHASVQTNSEKKSDMAAS